MGRDIETTIEMTPVTSESVAEALAAAEVNTIRSPQIEIPETDDTIPKKSGPDTHSRERL